MLYQFPALYAPNGTAVTPAYLDDGTNSWVHYQLAVSGTYRLVILTAGALPPTDVVVQTSSP